MRPFILPLLAATLLAAPLSSQAGSRSDAVVGSIIGGATGAVIGNNLGGRDGAIVGGAIGAAAGVAIATDRDGRRYDAGRYERDDRHHYRGDRYREVVVVESPRHHYRGNEFVYGVPPRHDHGRHRGWDRRDERRHHHHDRYRRDSREVVVIHHYDRDYRYPHRR